MSLRAELADRLERELGTDELPGMWRLPAADVRIIIAALRGAPSEAPHAEQKPATLRYGGDGNLDEVFAEPCQFHLEQMDNGHWWIGVNAPDRFYHINLHARGRIRAHIEGEERHELASRYVPQASE